jgi:hypothetical protein
LLSGFIDIVFVFISRVKISVVNLCKLLLNICVTLTFLTDVSGWYSFRREDFLGSAEKLARGKE